MRDDERLGDAIRRAYAIVGRATPLKADCGALCGRACCKEESLYEYMGGPSGDAAQINAEAGAGEPTNADAGGSENADNTIDGSAPDRTGMYLFPGEYGLYPASSGRFRFYRVPFFDGWAWFLICDGSCDRRARPLACRIFPLAPHVGEAGGVTSLPDPRARRMCPLADCEYLEPAFRRAVTSAFRYLAKEPVILKYMKLLSADLADMRRFIK